MLHVPYKGGGPAIAAVVSGEVQAMFGPPQASLQHIRGGKLRALATTLPSRAPFMPDVPTMAEAGVPILFPTAVGSAYSRPPRHPQTS
ncbi:MAG: hypothetical protein EXR39_16805 [Betaproteobacteria bacterium]|nr:hypothetical protein [Betaproteobacteria bacterium]